MRRLEKLKALAELKREMEVTFAAKKMVFGEGDVTTKLVVVGEAPGRNEEKEGRPFVGKAGQILSSLLLESLIDRDKIWITNVVKWRPVKDSHNRPPDSKEIQSNSIYLKRELDIISPKIILCLGNIPSKVLVKKDFKMKEEHGEWFRGSTGALVIATYHPAFILRQSKQNRQLILKIMQDDFDKVRFLHEFYHLK